MSSVISSPYALPVGPTRLAESNTSIPPPEPRSSTVSPSFSSASAVGLPQPSEAFTANSGKASTWPLSYKSRVIGSTSVPQLEAPQQELPLPAVTRRAAAPYFSFTTSLICFGIEYSFYQRQQTIFLGSMALFLVQHSA